MANRRWRWYLGLLVGLILIPPLLWVLVVVVAAPTGWAKGKVSPSWSPVAAVAWHSKGCPSGCWAETG